MKIKNIINSSRLFIAGSIAFVSLTSCETQFYDEEQYRKEIYIVSGDENMYGQEFEFGKESVGYLSIYASGTTPIESDVEVELELNPQYLRSYNQRVYGDDYASYARQLEAENYTIESMKIVIPKNNEDPYVKFPIKVNVNNITDDAEYYIPLRIKSVSKYMISEARRNVLFRIYKKNEYASTKTNSYYTMNGVEQLYTLDGEGNFVSGDPATAVNATKPLIPVSQYSVRMMPNGMGATSDAAERNNSLLLTVHPDVIVDVPVLSEGIPTGQYVKRQKVTVEAWDYSANAIEIADIDGEQSYYDPQTMQFTLNYRYRLANSKQWHFMNEVMKPLSINNK